VIEAWKFFYRTGVGRGSAAVGIQILKSNEPETMPEKAEISNVIL